jgi:hypothetical protein
MLKKILLSSAIAVAAGALSFGASAIADASPSSSSSAPTATHAAANSTAQATRVPKVGKTFNCANADNVLARIQKGEARIAAGLPKLTAAQTKAQAAGHIRRAARLQKVITRAKSAAFAARLDKVSQKIVTVCHVAAPGTAAP